MDFKQYLLSLVWNTFKQYPKQGSDIYLHCFTEDSSIHKFVKVKQFNAVCFDFQKIVNNQPNHQWQFAWLPATTIETNYGNSTSR